MLHLSLTDESELEAELLAMQGVSPSPGKGKQGGGKAPMSVEQINKMVAGIEGMGEGDDDLSDLSDLDENELLGELQVSVCVCSGVYFVHV